MTSNADQPLSDHCPAPKHSFVSARVRRTVQCFIQSTVPADRHYSEEFELRVLNHCCETLNYVPEAAQLPFKVGLWTLEFAAFLMAPGWKRFSELPAKAQKAYVERWAHHSLFLFRDFFKALKGFVMLAYYEQPELMKDLEYAPQKYIDELKANDSYQRD